MTKLRLNKICSYIILKKYYYRFLLGFLVLLNLAAGVPESEAFWIEKQSYLIVAVAFFIFIVAGIIYYHLINNQFRKHTFELKQARDIARQNEEKYRLLAENTSDVVWLSDLNFNLSYISPSVEKILGWKASERLKMSVEEKVPPIEIEKLRTTLREELEKETVPGVSKNRSRILELQHYHANGSIVWVEMNISLVRDNAGRPVGINGISRDITEKRRAGKYIKKRLAMEKLLSKISGKAIADSDVNIIIKKILKKAGAAMKVSRVYVFEYDSQNNTANNTFEWCDKGIVPQIDNLRQQPVNEVSWVFNQLKQGKSIAYKDIGEIPDEPTKNAFRLQNIVSILVVPLTLNDRFHGFIGFDECRKAKKWHPEDVKLLQSIAYIVASLLERHKSKTDLKIKDRAIELSLVAKAILDLEGRFTYVNQTFLRYWKYQKMEEVSDRTMYDFLESYEERGKVTAKLRENGSWQGELKGIRSDGTVFDALVQASIVTNNQGKPICMQASFFDITERKIWEQELLKAKEKAEESSRLKSTFLRNMSHEIRTPMNGILGFVNILKDVDLSFQEKEEYIFMINESGKRLMNTINDLIESSIIEIGETAVKKVETDLSEIMSQIYSQFKPDADKKNILLEINNKTQKHFIQTDKTKLERILQKLINNALKFTEKGRVEFGFDVKKGFVYFHVKDTGAGISENQIEKILHPFIQADMGLTRRYEGSGLGLFISKAYVELLGGKIWFESKVNEGTAFFFTVPDEQVKSYMEPEKPGWRNLLNGHKVLIADDDYYSYLFLESSLKRSGAEILHTETGKDTVQALRDNPDISLILMDIKMPGMDGLEATGKIREFNAGVPIIAQSALVFPHENKEVLEAGCNDYIAKPIDYDLLLGKIKQLLN